MWKKNENIQVFISANYLVCCQVSHSVYFLGVYFVNQEVKYVSIDLKYCF